MNNELPKIQSPSTSLFYFTSLESFEKWYELLLALEQIKTASTRCQTAHE